MARTSLAGAEGEGLLLLAARAPHPSRNSADPQTSPRFAGLWELVSSSGPVASVVWQGAGRNPTPASPAAVPALLQRLRTETSLSLGKQFLLLSEINRERKTFKFLLAATTSLPHTPFPLRK